MAGNLPERGKNNSLREANDPHSPSVYRKKKKKQ
jgi:hypothetical protein